MSDLKRDTKVVRTPKSRDELTELLAALIAPDTAAIKQATESVKAFLRQRECVAALLDQMSESPHLDHRHISSVLLRQVLSKHFNNLDPSRQTDIKAFLLERLVREPARPVRLAVAALIASLAKSLLPLHQWDQLLPWLLECSKSKQHEHREVALLLFRALSETSGGFLRPHFQTLQLLFTQTLQDPHECVRTEGLRALGSIVEDISTRSKKEAIQICTSIPTLVEIVGNSIKATNEDVCNIVLGVLDAMVEKFAQAAAGYAAALVPVVIAVCQETRFELTVRAKASLVLGALLKTGGKHVRTQVGDAISCGFALVTEHFEDEQFEPAQLTPQKMAFEILETILSTLPDTEVLEPIMTACIRLTQSERANERKGGYVVMAVAAVRCSDAMRNNMKNLLPLICGALKDTDRFVRASACVALTQFADMQPEILAYHSVVLPSIFAALEKQDDAFVTKNLAIAMSVFGSTADADLKLYVEPIMTRLVKMIQTKNIDLANYAILSIQAIAVAAKDDFLPFFDVTITILSTLMSLTDEEHLQLRGHATACAGAIVMVVGRERFAPLLERFVKLALDGVKREAPVDLRESTYQFFAAVARTFGEDANPALACIMPFVLESCQSDEGVTAFAKTSALDTSVYPNVVEDDDVDDTANDIDAKVVRPTGGIDARIQTGALEEKVAAFACLAAIIADCEVAYLPHLKPSIDMLDDVSAHPHPSVRRAAFGCWASLVARLHKIVAKTDPAKSELKDGDPRQLRADSLLVLGQLVTRMVLHMTQDNCVEVVLSATATLGDICAAFHLVASPETALASVCSAISDLLRERSVYQQECKLERDALDAESKTEEKNDNPDEDGGCEDDEDDVSENERIFDSVTTLIAKLAKSLGAAFEPYFGKLLEPLLYYSQPHQTDFNRAAAWGCCGEVFEALGEKCAPHLSTLFPLVSVRQNAAFCAGILCMSGPDSVAHYSATLTKLVPLFEVETKDADSGLGACRDNACSAVAKMILCAGGVLPLEHVVPLFLRGLPLASDHDESKYVYGALLKLFSEQPQSVMPHLPQIVPILVHVLVAATCDIETHKGLLILTRSLITQLKSEMEVQIGRLPGDLRDKFINVVSSGVS